MNEYCVSTLLQLKNTLIERLTNQSWVKWIQERMTAISYGGGLKKKGILRLQVSTLQYLGTELDVNGYALWGRGYLYLPEFISNVLYMSFRDRTFIFNQILNVNINTPAPTTINWSCLCPSCLPSILLLLNKTDSLLSLLWFQNPVSASLKDRAVSGSIIKPLTPELQLTCQALFPGLTAFWIQHAPVNFFAFALLVSSAQDTFPPHFCLMN